MQTHGLVGIKSEGEKLTDTDEAVVPDDSDDPGTRHPGSHHPGGRHPGSRHEWGLVMYLDNACWWGVNLQAFCSHHQF